MTKSLERRTCAQSFVGSIVPADGQSCSGSALIIPRVRRIIFTGGFIAGVRAMLSRTPERRMRRIRTGLLLAWLVLIVSLLWDPLTPALTAPDNLASPFHLGPAPMVQGTVLTPEPYPMGARIFWTMILPFIPLS